MSQPTTPVTRAPGSSYLSLDLTPEDGLLAPLSLHQIAAWMDHQWLDEPIQRIHDATEEVWALYWSLEHTAGQVVLNRLLGLIDYMDDCFMEVVLPGPMRQ